MDFNSTVKGSNLEGFYPEGWDFKKIDECCSHKPEEICDRQAFWNDGFEPVSCDSLGDFEVKMGHEIANEIKAVQSTVCRRRQKILQLLKELIAEEGG